MQTPVCSQRISATKLFKAANFLLQTQFQVIMKNLFILWIAISICSCQQIQTFENQIVDFHLYTGVLNLNSSVVIENAKIVGHFTTEIDENIDRWYRFEGDMTIYDSANNLIAKFDTEDIEHSTIKFYKNEQGVNYCSAKVKGAVYEGEGGFYYLHSGTLNAFELHDGTTYLSKKVIASEEKREEYTYYPNGQLQHLCMQKEIASEEKIEEYTYYPNGQLQHLCIWKIWEDLDGFSQSEITEETWYAEDGTELPKWEQLFRQSDYKPVFECTANKNYILVFHPFNNNISKYGKAFLFEEKKYTIGIIRKMDYEITNDGYLRFYNVEAAYAYRSGWKKCSDMIFDIDDPFNNKITAFNADFRYQKDYNIRQSCEQLMLSNMK